MRGFYARPIAVLAWLLMGGISLADAKDFASHPPMRPLPGPSDRAMAKGPAFFVDAAKGDDAHDGSRELPWQTINHALRQLKSGSTLYLAGGTYYEHLVIPVSGAEGKPITIRSLPGQLAIIDGGLREFFEAPVHAWQPFPEGAKDEFVSTNAYPQFAERPVLNAFMSNGWEPFQGLEDHRPVVLGNFGDSLVPLHGYRTLADLRDESMLADTANKGVSEEGGVYCGPGLWYNRQTQRIHIRLAHTNLEGLGQRAYRGVTDPRIVPLVISGPSGADVLRINGIKHLVVQDLVLRGASGSPLINLYGSEDISFDGVTVYGGAPGLLVKSTGNVRVTNCAFRGLAAPWSSRASMKYRGTPSYQIMADQNQPENHDFELANNEFTDDHDFAYVRFIKNLKFHHNFVDNFNDDGLELGARKRDQEVYVYQNLFSRCLINFSLHEICPDESPATVNPGSGVYIARNVVDLRPGTFKSPPSKPDPTGSYLHESGMLSSDHGGPTWPNYFFYHNTVLRPDGSFRGYYGFGMGGQGLRNTQRRVLNNIFVQLDGVPGLNFVPDYEDVLVDGNLHWGVVAGPSYEGDFFKQKRLFVPKNKSNPYPETWMAHDRFADPKFARLDAGADAPYDLTLRSGSPAANAGVAVPSEWHDPLRSQDEGQPDIGAFPLRVRPSTIGIHGRLSAFGETK